MGDPPPVSTALLLELQQALLSRPPGGCYSEFGRLLHSQVGFDRMSLLAAESGGGGLRVLHALAGESGSSEAVGRLVPLSGSLAGEVYREQRWLRIDDLPAALAAIDGEVPEDALRARRVGMMAGLGLPLRCGEQPVGVCLLWSQAPDHFRGAHEALLCTLQPALSASLRNDLLFVETERRSLELGALERLARASRTSLELDQVIPACLDAALSLLGLSTGGLLLRSGDRLELALSRNLHLPGPLSVPLSPDEGGSVLQLAVSGRAPVLCQDLTRDPHLRILPALMPARHGPVWLLAIPLVAGEERRGVIFACGHGAWPTPSELERLTTIGHWIGSAIADAERHRAARELARQQAEQRRRQQNMESLSNLAGGLAHDFNNTLGAILLTALLLREAAQGCDAAPLQPMQLLRDIDVIIQAARRGAALAGQLLAFSRGAPLHLTLLDINDVVKQAFMTQRESWPPHVLCERVLCPDLPLVRGDREQLVRAVQNLLRNALEAMPGGGRLRIETCVWEGAPGEPAAADGIGEALPAGRYVRVLIMDEGEGIDPTVRARLFEPFVTTKKSAAGLGLAVVFGTVRAHGGSISVDTGRERGTTFSIDLPAAAPRAHESAGLPAVPPASARVLVVDDEPVLVRIAARILRKDGYTVDTAESGGDALQRYGRSGAYDLVILDSTMPGMSGREVLEELRRRDPQVRVLVMSGYSIDGGPAELMRQGARGFLPKPFTPQELLQAAQRALVS